MVVVVVYKSLLMFTCVLRAVKCLFTVGISLRHCDIYVDDVVMFELTVSHHVCYISVH